MYQIKFPTKEDSYKCIGSDSMTFFHVALFGLKPGQIDGTCLVHGGYLAGDVCARTGNLLFSVLNVGPTVLFETIYMI